MRLRGRRAVPRALGLWPAAAGLLIFTWIELASGWGEHPARLATATVVYSVLTWIGMALLRRRDVDAPRRGVRRLLQPALAPVDLREARPRGRPAAAAGRPAAARAPAGNRRLRLRDDRHRHVRRPEPGRALDRHLQSLFDTFGTTLADTIGLLLGVALVAGFYRLGMAGARTVGGGFETNTLARAFVHSLVPIAAVYVAAHYLTFLIFEGQAIRYTAADPFGQGWDLFGWAERRDRLRPALARTPPGICRSRWSSLGHVAALVLAHDRALVTLRSAAPGGALPISGCSGS